MRKFWIFMAILFVIVLIIAVGCAVSDSFKTTFGSTMIGMFGTVAVTVGDWWTSINANPVYQQWHMLIWFIGGIIGTVIFTKLLWPRRPRLFQPKTTLTQTYQHAVEKGLPTSISEPVPENIAKPKPKEEEAVAK